MLIGTVKWFNKVKGYGFIVSENNNDDIFVHITMLEKAELRSLDEGQQVYYEAEIKDGRLRAISVSALEAQLERQAA